MLKIKTFFTLVMGPMFVYTVAEFLIGFGYFTAFLFELEIDRAVWIELNKNRNDLKLQNDIIRNKRSSSYRDQILMYRDYIVNTKRSRVKSIYERLNLSIKFNESI